MRTLLKKLVRLWPWPLTLNEKYDRQTKAVIRKVCAPDSVCVDIGCFRGDILQYMIDAAPQARHIAFEPVPQQYKWLKETFGAKADIQPYAIGRENGEAVFHHVVSNPTYSGLQRRKYKGEEKIDPIRVEVKKLDDVISPSIALRLIKIDVEGGEYDVLTGAADLLKKWRPYIIFEHGAGGSDAYGVKPGDLYDLLVTRLGYRICLMGDFLKNGQSAGFSLSGFEEQYNRGLNCYFLAVFPSSS